VFEQHLYAPSVLISHSVCVSLQSSFSFLYLAVMVEVGAEVWENAAGWLEVTGLARTLWRLGS